MAETPSREALESAIGGHLMDVPELAYIRREAKRLGIRVWLFGGTAAAYGHYANWDLRRRNGDARFQKDRFDYDYTNIFRSTQDLDLVVDGSPEKARELEELIQGQFRYLLGSKSQWEVRLLKQNMADKEAILDNPNFLGQHSDSNSTGVIEVTEPPRGEHLVRDVRDWNSDYPNFFEDIRLGKLHYYFSPTHGETSRAKEGKNPPILSAIRFLTKAFQYELEITPGDWRKIVRVIAEFDAERDMKDGYVESWIEKNGKKLFQHAVNMEYAWKILQRSGLREKLIEAGDPKVEESLAWWMSKAPLRSKPVGKGNGATAASLGISEVAHETKSFLAYESMTRSHKGEPNVFISRKSTPGERALYGDGFYTMRGRQGVVGTGITIRFRVNPDAREGTDFIRTPEQPDFVIVLNRNALTVIPESLNLSPLQYFELIARGEDFDATDKALVEKLKRRIGPRLLHIDGEERVKIEAFMEKLKHGPAETQPKNRDLVLSEWLALDVARKYPEIYAQFAERTKGKPLQFLDAGFVRRLAEQLEVKDAIKSPRMREFLEYLLDHRLGDAILSGPVIGHPAWDENPEAKAARLKFMRALEPGTYFARQLFKQWFQLPDSAGHPELLERFLGEPRFEDGARGLARADLEREKGFAFYPNGRRVSNADANIVLEAMKAAHWLDSPTGRTFLASLDPEQPASQEMLNGCFIGGMRGKESLLDFYLADPRWLEQPSTRGQFLRLLDKEELRPDLTKKIFTDPAGQPFREKLFKLVLEAAGDLKKEANRDLMRWWLEQPYSVKHPEVLRAMLQSENVGEGLADLLQGNRGRDTMTAKNSRKEISQNVFPEIAAALCTPHWRATQEGRELADAIRPEYQHSGLFFATFVLKVLNQQPADAPLPPIFAELLAKPWAGTPGADNTIGAVMLNEKLRLPFIRLTLSQEGWGKKMSLDAMDDLLKLVHDSRYVGEIARHLRNEPEWERRGQGDTILKILRRNGMPPCPGAMAGLATATGSQSPIDASSSPRP